MSANTSGLTADPLRELLAIVRCIRLVAGPDRGADALLLGRWADGIEDAVAALSAERLAVALALSDDDSTAAADPAADGLELHKLAWPRPAFPGSRIPPCAPDCPACASITT